MTALRLLLLLLICFLTLGCFSNPLPSPTLNPSPTSIEASLLHPTEKFQIPPAHLDPGLALTLAPPATEAALIPPTLVIITPDGLWRIYSNGIGLRKIIDDHVIAPQDTSAMPAPGGIYAAYITGDSRLRDLTLRIIHLERGLAYSIPLTSPEYAIQENSAQGDPEVEAARAVIERTSLAWSPDGSQLAFMGMREGASSDLYTFLKTDFWVFTQEQAERGIQTTRWTDGPSQGISPIWSPDGRYILHAGVNTLGTGAGYDMAGVWVVDTQTGEVLDLYVPEDGEEIFVGWTDHNTFLVYSWSPACGNQNLREFNIQTREAQAVWNTAFNGVAFDPASGGVMITIDQYAADCQEGGQRGAVFVPGNGAAVLPLTDQEAFLAVWDELAQVFFFRTADQVFAVWNNGVVKAIQAPAPSLPSASVDGRLVWAIRSGVWVGTYDTSPVQIFASPASLPVISPDGQTVFFVAEDGLFVAHAPEFLPLLVGEGLLGTGAFWVDS